MEKSNLQEQKETDSQSPKTDIKCKLVGTDGNIFALLGRAREALLRGDRRDLIEPLTKEVFASKSYEEALARICEYVVASCKTKGTELTL